MNTPKKSPAHQISTPDPIRLTRNVRNMVAIGMLAAAACTPKVPEPDSKRTPPIASTVPSAKPSPKAEKAPEPEQEHCEGVELNILSEEEALEKLCQADKWVRIWIEAGNRSYVSFESIEGISTRVELADCEALNGFDLDNMYATAKSYCGDTPINDVFIQSDECDSGTMVTFICEPRVDEKCDQPPPGSIAL